LKKNDLLSRDLEKFVSQHVLHSSNLCCFSSFTFSRFSLSLVKKTPITTTGF